MVTFCSLVTAATRAQARVLADSLRDHHPGARVIAWAPGSVGVDGADMVAPPGEPSIPALLAHALQDAETAVYLDPQVCVYASLEPFIATAPAGGVALVPRVASLPDDGLRPDYAALLDAGEISPAMVAVSRGDAAGTFLDWWLRRHEEGAVSDGRRLSLAREQLPEIAVVADPGCGASYWNLHERPLARDGESRDRCGQRPAHRALRRLSSRPALLAQRGRHARPSH